MPATLTNWLATAVRPRWLQGIFWPTLLLWLYAPELLPPYGLRRQSDSGDGAFERKRTPLSPRTLRACESGVAAPLCHRTPNDHQPEDAAKPSGVSACPGTMKTA